MALQGTIDTFPLTDVLALLETSAKAGLLSLTGSRGSGQIWLDGANIYGGTLDGDDSLIADRLLFELLRFEEGSFEFSAAEVDDFPQFDVSPMSIKTCIESAAQMLEQWEHIETIVPSVRHRISLAPELPSAELTVDAELWSFLVAIGGSETVSDAAAALKMDNYECSAVMASLVEQHLAVISDPSETSNEDEPATKDRDEPGRDAESVEYRGADSGDDSGVDDSGADSTLIEELQQEEAMWEDRESSFPERFPIDDLLLDAADDQDDPWGVGSASSDGHARNDGVATSDVSFSGLPEIEPLPKADSGAVHSASSGLKDWDAMVNMETMESEPTTVPDDTTDEVLRQMSKLSPKAAEAIAAALGSAPDGQPPTPGDETPTVGPVSFLDSF